MKLFYFIMGFITALIFAGLIITAIYHHLKRKRKNNQPVQGYLDLIPDLSEHQRDQVECIRKTFLPKVEGTRRFLCEKRRELANCLFEEPEDRQKIDAVSQQVIYYQARLEDDVIDHILEEKELLEPAQKRKFYEIIMEQFSTGSLGLHDVKNDKSRS